MSDFKALLEARPHAALVRAVGDVAARDGIAAYAVGGFVRDVLLGRPTADVDFVTVGHGTGIRLAELVAGALGGATAHVYPNFGTAAVRLHGPEGEAIVFEFVGARRESYRRDSRKPIVEEGTLQDDQFRRDFTINAMAFDVSPGRFGELVDPFDGLGDLERRLIRTPLEPHRTFEDDPLRMIRAARFAAQLGFTIVPEAFQAM
ncbi:MAG TPA: tRNA nucleotidyltransferase, partial [Rhodothermales bacterium]|nr:tRNA nucleotidyltransferase [Rhodothermales bacterium]